MSRTAAKNTNTLAWFVVLVAGVVIVLVVWGLSLFSRLDAGQSVLDGARPAFTEERVAGDIAGVEMIDYIVNMADPIVDAEGGAAGEVGPFVELVAGVTGLSQADVLVALEENFPHTFHLLLSLPLEDVSAEVPGLLDFVADNSELDDGDAVLAALSENTPNIAQAIVNLGVVTDNWRNVDGMDGVTRFDGSTSVESVPEIRDFFAADVIPAIGATAADFRGLDDPWPRLTLIPIILTVLGIVVVLVGMVMMGLTRTGAYNKSLATAGWSLVSAVGVLVVAGVLISGLFPRLGGGQDVIDGLRPAFTEERIVGMEVGIGIVDNVTNMADPIVDAEGGAAGEVGPFVELVAGVTGLSQADVLVALEENFPHTFHLLLSLPLEDVSAEVPGLLDFVADNSELADGDAVLAALSENTPNIAQAIVNLGVVTDNWRNVDGTADLTRFDGSNVTSFPEVRTYLAADVVPAVRAIAEDFRELDETAPPVNIFPWLLTIIGLLVLVYGAAMVAITRSTAPTYMSTIASEIAAQSYDDADLEPEPAVLVGVE